MWSASTASYRTNSWTARCFHTLLEAKVLVDLWRRTYNTARPHNSLGYRPPAPESRRPCPLAWLRLRKRTG